MRSQVVFIIKKQVDDVDASVDNKTFTNLHRWHHLNKQNNSDFIIKLRLMELNQTSPEIFQFYVLSYDVRSPLFRCYKYHHVNKPTKFQNLLELFNFFKYFTHNIEIFEDD